MYEQDPAEVEDLSDGAGMSSEDTGKISQHELLMNTRYSVELFVSIIQDFYVTCHTLILGHGVKYKSDPYA